MSGTVESDLKVYNTGGPFQIAVDVNHAVNFPNLGAYWTVVSKESVEDGVKAVWNGREAPPSEEPSDPLVADAARFRSDRNLQSTELVQVNLPEIQQMVEKLKATGKTNRLDMAKEIVKVVTQYLKYDHDSVETGFVYPLSTSDILKRHLGVCQHFANLFTALARGVGIPTRMVAGVYISADSLDLHGWNEIEIRDGVWRPVEPQIDDLSIAPTVYIPTLDNANEKTTNSVQELAAMVKLTGVKLTIKILKTLQN